MDQRYFDDFQDPLMYKKIKDQDLLGAGWQPLYRELDWGYLWQLVSKDPWQLSKKTINLTSYMADALGRKDFAWWANVVNVFSDYTRNNIDEFWDYITPELPGPDERYKDVLSAETPVSLSVSRDRIPLDCALERLQEITVLKAVELLGRPDIITQCFDGRTFYYPTDKFVDWKRLKNIGTILAYWSKHDTWLEISGWQKRRYTLIAQDLAPLVNKATYNLAVMISGYQNRIGQIHSQFPIRTFPAGIQNFTDAVQQAIFDQNRLAVLVHGEPGTGKTAWTQAVAKEILAPLGYVIFILDHDSAENFVPPSYLERICLIINEADNLAQDRSSEAAQYSNKTERILSLLDGTLYQSVMDESGIQAQQRLVVLLTCNTTERLDPAVLRKGRVDLMCEFTTRLV